MKYYKITNKITGEFFYDIFEGKGDDSIESESFDRGLWNDYRWKRDQVKIEKISERKYYQNLFPNLIYWRYYIENFSEIDDIQIKNFFNFIMKNINYKIYNEFESFLGEYFDINYHHNILNLKKFKINEHIFCNIPLFANKTWNDFE